MSSSNWISFGVAPSDAAKLRLVARSLRCPFSLALEVVEPIGIEPMT